MEANPEAMSCARPGRRHPAIVCRHHIAPRGAALGFVENSDDPDDLQAWCDACESRLVKEGGMTEALRAFNSFAVVCVECYVELKMAHTRER